MSPERWQRAKEIFHRALEEEDLDARRQYLRHACAEDSELRREVDSLLGHDEGPLSSEVAADQDDGGRGGHVGAFLPAASGPSKMPRRIGPYKVFEILGRGGLGTVYLAGRDDGHYHKRVAIKVIRRGMDTEDVLRRFAQERQILAALEHPYIARLLDGGATDDGVPYFVMEHVDGLPIDRFCDEQSLSIDDRLRLFCTVCTAVHHAHQNLVVHRDLKPANVLVTADGTPKLVDFGIAKLLNPELSGRALEPTAVGWRLLTPEYASPEQLLGKSVTTASDVYSLGVVLYRLLTGRSAHEGRRRSIEDLEEAAAADPEPPSLAVGSGDSPIEVAARRGFTPARLRRRLRGDLDKITAMALRREPLRRYPSTEGLANDLRRHMAGQTVIARKDTLGYRLASLLQRHRVAVLATAALFVVVLAGAAATLWQARAAWRERARVEQLLRSSEAERLRAEQVSEFLVDLFEVSDPWAAPDRGATAREILDRGAKTVVRELQDQPRTQVRLMNTIGRIYQNLGLYEEAAAILEPALQIGRERLGEADLEVAASLNQLAQVLDLQGDSAAEGLYRQALELRREGLESPHVDLAESLMELGELLYLKGDYPEAVDLIQEALEMRRDLLGTRHPAVAESLQVLGELSHTRSAYARAEELYLEALAIRRSHFGPDHPDIARSLATLGELHRNRGEHARVQALIKKALEMRRELFGERHPAVAESLNLLGLIAVERKAYNEAVEIFEDVVRRWREIYGEEHDTVAQALNNLGWALQHRGETAAAETHYREALRLLRQAYSAHPMTVMTLNNLAATLRDQGQPREAEPFLREALTMHRELMGDEHPFTGSLHHQLAWVLYFAADPAAAEEFERALVLERAVWPEDHPEIGSSLVGLGLARIDRGRAAEALPLIRRGLEIRAASLDENDWRLEWDRLALGRCLLALDRPEEAAPLIRESRQRFLGRADVPEIIRRRLEEPD